MKARKFCIYGDVFYITHMPYVENFRILHIWHEETSKISPCGEILNFPTIVIHGKLKFLHMTIFSTNNISDKCEVCSQTAQFLNIVFHTWLYFLLISVRRYKFL